jgi:Na+-driven multidrug efflux pump
LIFELQIIALGHIANIPQEAVAAGAIWVQTESTLAAVQRGWLQVTRMRTLKLMGNNDAIGAKKAYTAMCVLSFLLVAITNIPLLVWSDDIGVLVSNDVNVQQWLNRIVWVLALHTQTRICSINGGAIYIAVERGTLKVVQNVVGFYVVASPLAAVGALTNMITTTDIATKMIFCVSATAVAQFVIGAWAFLDMGCNQDWVEGGKIVARRANNDRILAQSSTASGGGSTNCGSPLLGSPWLESPMLTPSLLPRQLSPLRSISAGV